jgi:uncharacterized protein YbaR (Trm112 family)
VSEAATDLELIRLLDFEPEIPCEVGDCGAVAGFVWVCPKCRHSQFLCGPHAEGLRRKRERLAAGKTLACRKCWATYRAEDSPIEPIKGGS